MDRRLVLVLVLLNVHGISGNSDAWIRYKGKAYLEATLAMTFPNSQANCASKLSHLVNIENQDENDHVKTFNAGALTWIGVTRNAAGNWTNWKGQYISYSKWYGAGPFDAAVINYHTVGEWGEKSSVSDGPFKGACERELIADQGYFVSLTTSAGSDPVVMTKVVTSSVNCAELCVQQINCGCFGYNDVSKSCSTFKWQPTILSGSVYYCFNEILM